MNQNELAFERWKEENKEKLMSLCPATVGFNGAANNYSHWCRQVYTGRIKVDLENGKKEIN